MNKDLLGIIAKFCDFETLKVLRTLNRSCCFIAQKHFNEKVDWFKMSWKPDPPDFFIEKYQNQLNWRLISMCGKLSEDFIRKFQNRVDWSMISQYQKLSEAFIREFQDFVNWYMISGYQKITPAFVREFHRRLDMGEIYMRGDIY